MAMPGVRLTKAEKKHLLETALREKDRRRNANRKAREIRSAQGRHRLEKTVPAHHLAEIRRLVAAMLAELQAGREPRLRRGDPVPPAEPGAPDVVDDSGPTTTPPPGTPGLGPVGRRRAQAARRRERQRAAGLARTTFDVPAELVDRISKLIDRMVAWMSEGAQVILEAGPVQSEVAIPEPMREPKPTRTTVARVLEDLVANADDLVEQDTSPLFEDIKAAARFTHGFPNFLW
jgi:hypothetical protein